MVRADAARTDAHGTVAEEPPLLSESGALLRTLREVDGGPPFEQAVALLRPRLSPEPPLERALDALADAVAV
eukprot:21723-Prymnesium_polylepis.1